MKEEVINVVDLDSAKRLRRLGFDIPTSMYYQDMELPYSKAGLRVVKNGKKINHNSFDDFLFSAPTIKEANEWLLDTIENFELKEFDTHDWNSFHDCLYNASLEVDKSNPISLSIDELKELFLSLPDDLRADSKRWGMSDTPWRDSLYNWYIENNKNK